MPNFQTPEVPVSLVKLGGGLNSASGPLKLNESESPDLQNINFHKFGSIVKRNGYYWLNPTPVSYVGSRRDEGVIVGQDMPIVQITYSLETPGMHIEFIEIPDVTLTHIESKA